MATPLEKFQSLLRELFQFEQADLDFGVYRIMNLRRERMKKWLNEELPARARAILKQGGTTADDDLSNRLEALKAALLELEPGGVDEDGNITKDFLKESTKGKEYLKLKAQHDRAPVRTAANLEPLVYNHLYDFFSRYYDTGDFIPKRRRSFAPDGRDTYAIPWDGEEVVLHWANKDQYYIKTGERFTHYRWQADAGGRAITIEFRLTDADLPANNNKDAKKKFNLLVPEKVEWLEDKATLILPFHYRGLTPEEEAQLIGTQEAKLRESIITRTVDTLRELPAVSGVQHLATALMASKRDAAGQEKRDTAGNAVPLLPFHLNRWAVKNESDFFIHKDLRRFLSGELDYFLKSVVLNLDNLLAAGEQRAEPNFRLLDAVKRLGTEIIDFVSQLEDFQKALFEKKKFVLETSWCLTLDRIPSSVKEEVYAAILANDRQWKEWETLYKISKWPADLATIAPRTREFLDANPCLMLDTGLKTIDGLPTYNSALVEQILGGIEDLGEQTDGLITHSENFQALNLLAARYLGAVQGVYIDPPYNTDAEPICYKNGLRSSSWVAMLRQSLSITRAFCAPKGVLCATIDDYQQKELHFLIGEAFGSEGYAVHALLNAQTHELLVQADAEFHLSDSWSARRRWEDTVFDLLKGAFDRIYRRAQQTWETQNMTLPVLREDHPNYKFTYKVRVSQKLASTSPQFIRDLQTLIAQCPKQNWTGQEAVMAVANFGEHLYQPLVLDAENPNNLATPNAAEKQQLTITPPSLTASEQEFVEMLRDYRIRSTAYWGKWQEALKLGSQASAFARRGDAQRAIALYDKAQTLNEELGDRQGLASSLGGIAAAHASKGDADKAIEFYDKAQALNGEIGDKRGQASALGGIAAAHARKGDADKAIEFFERGLALRVEIGDKRGQASTLGGLAAAHALKGDVDRAIEFQQKALALSVEIGDKRGQASALGGMAAAHAKKGDADKAIEFNERGLALSVEIGDKRGQASALGGMAAAHANRGDADKAIKFYDRAQVLNGEIGDKHGQASAFGGIAAAYAKKGDADKAIEFYDRAQALNGEIGDKRGQASALGGIAAAHAARGNADKAIEFYDRAQALNGEIGDKRGQASALGGMAAAHAKKGDADKAIEFNERGLALSVEIGDKHGQASALGGIAAAHAKKGDADKAIEFYDRAQALNGEIGDKRGQASALGGIATAHAKKGDADKAIEFYEKCLALRIEIGDRHGQAATLGGMAAVHARSRHPKRAIELYLETLDLNEQVGNRPFIGITLRQLSKLASTVGDQELKRWCEERLK
jgi:tetratricopeptide (TPR) repeat protein